MNKTVYIYWDTELKNAPYVVKKCALSWKLHNPTWNIIELDDNNLKEHIDIEKEIPNIKKKTMKPAFYSDIVRMFLLEKYGGCWCDATIFCTKPLDDWLISHVSSSGFFAFEKPGPDRLLSNWFLYSNKNNYIVKKWKEIMVTYWNNNDEMYTYFGCHYLFGFLYYTDSVFKNNWDDCLKISSDIPHHVQFFGPGLLEPLNQNIKQHIDNKQSPLYKLTYRYDEKKYNDKCCMAYLFNTVNISFIHIGKCGGTFIRESLNIKSHHMERNYDQNDFFIIWLRNPLNRFVSSFWFLHNIINTDIKNLNVK
jgi:hypothetical protein